jgi:hypothetical protein
MQILIVLLFIIERSSFLKKFILFAQLSFRKLQTNFN